MFQVLTWKSKVLVSIIPLAARWVPVDMPKIFFGKVIDGLGGTSVCMQCEERQGFVCGVKKGYWKFARGIGRAQRALPMHAHTSYRNMHTCACNYIHIFTYTRVHAHSHMHTNVFTHKNVCLMFTVGSTRHHVCDPPCPYMRKSHTSVHLYTEYIMT